jgi:hypothetical protein
MNPDLVENPASVSLDPGFRRDDSQGIVDPEPEGLNQ